MLDFLRNIFPSMNLGSRKPILRQCVYANGSNQNPSSRFGVKKSVNIFESTPLVQNDEKRGAKVKIVMSKEAAARLLSKCKNGGIIELNDVPHDFNAISLLSCKFKDE
ncbi:hypothetical protein CASFOL_020242 [Castilleja foliolosa]|uniref:DUF7890 domain-containing protein n=1 Tax=Castilleja foliolosa TaxID=1961234 RepID=A0ABD3D414_9LAMI